ncbi:MAG: histidine kinase N-terminal 7TM domain-containing protein [archaeon]
MKASTRSWRPSLLESATRLSRIDDPDTRRGFRALLHTTSGWAFAHVAFLLAPSAPLKHAFYLVGLSAVGAWLYFCSASTNRSFHRQATFRSLAVAVFRAIITVKLTNPLHGLYYTRTLVSSPFVHLAVTHHVAHWIVMGLSYALSLVGFFMLVGYFSTISYRLTPLLGLIVITGLPIVFGTIGFTTPYLIDITYEPIGVAIFAVGVMFVYLDRLRTIQLAASQDAPIIG